MGVTAEYLGKKEIGTPDEQEARGGLAEPPREAFGPVMLRPDAAAREYRFTVTGASRDIAMTRSCTFRAHGAVIVRGPVLEAGLWTVELVQPVRN